MVRGQLNSTKCQIRIDWDNASAFSCPNGVMKHLIINSKPIQNMFTGGNLLESGINQFLIGNWELRNFSMIGYVKWQNSWDNVFLRLFYTSLFSLPKRLACLSEARKLVLCSICLSIGGLFQPYQNGATAVLLRKRHQQSPLILRWPTSSNAIALTPDCRAGYLMGAECELPTLHRITTAIQFQLLDAPTSER